MSFMHRIITPKQIPSVLIKIDQFASLKKGWHYGSGGPIVGYAADTAKQLYAYLTSIGFTRSNVFAGESGEILLSVYYRKSHIGITIDPDGLFEIAEEIDGRERRDLECKDISFVKTYLLNMAKALCNTSGSFTPIIMTKTLANSTIWHSRSLPMEAECL